MGRCESTVLMPRSKANGATAKQGCCCKGHSLEKHGICEGAKESYRPILGASIPVERLSRSTHAVSLPELILGVLDRQALLPATSLAVRQTRYAWGVTPNRTCHSKYPFSLFAAEIGAFAGAWERGLYLTELGAHRIPVSVEAH